MGLQATAKKAELEAVKVLTSLTYCSVFVFNKKADMTKMTLTASYAFNTRQSLQYSCIGNFGVHNALPKCYTSCKYHEKNCVWLAILAYKIIAQIPQTALESLG